MVILSCRNTSKYTSLENEINKKKKKKKRREMRKTVKKGDANILFASTRSGLKRLTARTGNVSERMQWAASRETLQELCVGLHYRRPELSTQPRDLAYQTLEWGRNAPNTRLGRPFPSTNRTPGTRLFSTSFLFISSFLFCKKKKKKENERREIVVQNTGAE